MATNNDDRDNLSCELEEPGLPDLQQELQNAAIKEMNYVTFGDDVVICSESLSKTFCETDSKKQEN